ncbi:coiled-coil domain-containing protein 175 [Etheostoma spectabile]|uniref:coiled-coil domain-containing protein 175 n=1 Tax=Etheostoma spectabile TaxID=54343 RepID=UPI0013AF55E1|nr:coiled-coil domain-containing protein 175-like [Etheostoma spectabile]
MASCLVPDFPAVMVALEHLKELDKQLKEEGSAFSPEASLHLSEITAAITELEAERHAAHEHLEVETIENSKLRHQINNIREKMSQEIMADVVAARASNAEEIEMLQKDLHAVSQLQEATVKRQEALLSQNEALYPEREQVKAEHEEIIGAQNDQIALKYSLQMHLDQTQNQIEELKFCIAAIGQDKIMLEQKMVLEREAFAVKNDSLFREVDQAEEKIKEQKLVNRRSRIELDRLNEKKQETHNQLGELTIDLEKLEGKIQRLAEDLRPCEKQRQGETQKHQELRQQREALKKELHELEEAFRVAIQRLKEEIATVDDKIEESRAARLLCQDSLAKIYKIFKQQHDEESEVKAEHFHVSQQLQQSKLQLEESISSIVRHSKEIKEMDKQIGELLQAEIITKRVLERNQEKLCDNMDAEKRNICHFEAEKKRLTMLLEEGKRKQEEHVAKMSSDIINTETRYQDLRREEAALRKSQPKCENAELLMSHMAQCEVEYRQKETQLREEIEQCVAETESIMRSHMEKQREAEEQEEILKEVEANWIEEKSRHQGLKTLTSELKRKKRDLELSIQGLKEKTDSLLQPKDQTKAELDEMRRSYMDVLRQQASELRAVEMSIYDSSVKMEQVRMENSRLHLCIRQMTEDVGAARENKERYWLEVHQLRQDIRALFESLQEAWRDDLTVTQERQNSDGVLLASMSATLNHLKTRRQQLGNIGTLLHQQMLDFSRRLGDKTTVEQQS